MINYRWRVIWTFLTQPEVGNPECWGRVQGGGGGALAQLTMASENPNAKSVPLHLQVVSVESWGGANF